VPLDRYRAHSQKYCLHPLSMRSGHFSTFGKGVCPDGDISTTNRTLLYTLDAKLEPPKLSTLQRNQTIDINRYIASIPLFKGGSSSRAPSLKEREPARRVISPPCLHHHLTLLGIKLENSTPIYTGYNTREASLSTPVKETGPLTSSVTLPASPAPRVLAIRKRHPL